MYPSMVFGDSSRVLFIKVSLFQRVLKGFTVCFDCSWVSLYVLIACNLDLASSPGSPPHAHVYCVTFDPHEELRDSSCGSKVTQ